MPLFKLETDTYLGRPLKKRCSFFWTGIDLVKARAWWTERELDFSLSVFLGGLYAVHTLYTVWRGSPGTGVENTASLFWEGGSQPSVPALGTEGPSFDVPRVSDPKSLICNWYYKPYTACEIISIPDIKKKEQRIIIIPALCFFDVLLLPSPLSPTCLFLLIRSHTTQLGACEKIWMYWLSCIHRRPRRQQPGLGGWEWRSSHSPAKTAHLPSSSIWQNPLRGMQSVVVVVVEGV